MKITLSYTEGRTVRTRVTPDLNVALHEVRVHTWNRSHVYNLPAVAWWLILDELRAAAYGPMGGRAQRSSSLYTAIAKITDAVLTNELHPAFTEGRGVVGIAADIIPAFVNEDGTRSPYPPGRFVLLLPQHITSRGRTLTVWQPGGWSPGQEATHSEEFHLRFGVKVGVGGAEHRRIPEL